MRASHRLIIVALVVVVSALGAAGCEEGNAGDDVVALWHAEADAHGPMGKPGTFRIEGNEVLTGPSQPLELQAPFTASIRVDATMAEGSGSLHCVQPVDVSAGSISDIVVSEVRTSTAAGAVPELRFFAATDTGQGRAEGIVIDDVTGCTLNVGNDFIDVTGGPVTTSGAVDPFALVLASSSAPVLLSLDELGVGGDGAGVATVDGFAFGDVQAVFGGASSVRIDGAVIEGDGNITQVISSEGPQLASDIELLADGGAVVVAVGERAPIALHFRERSFTGDALLASYEVEGEAAEHIELAVVAPGGLVGELFASIDDAGIAAPFVALAVIITLPFAIGVDIVDNILNPQVLPVPFPTFVHAGQIGTFSVVVDATELAPGTHEATLVVGGQNFAEQRVDLRWTVVEPAAQQ